MRRPRVLSDKEILMLKTMHAEGALQDEIWKALGITKRRYLQYRKILHLPPREKGFHGDKHPSWKGGRRRHGMYWLLWMPDHPHAMGKRKCYVYEHRIVMERHLGRILESHEIVHHKNGDGSDNRLENLELTDQSSHMSEHARERWLKETEAGRLKKLQQLQRGYAKHGLRTGGHAREKQRELTRQKKYTPKSDQRA